MTIEEMRLNISTTAMGAIISNSVFLEKIQISHASNKLEGRSIEKIIAELAVTQADELIKFLIESEEIQTKNMAIGRK